MNLPTSILKKGVIFSIDLALDFFAEEGLIYFLGKAVNQIIRAIEQ